VYDCVGVATRNPLGLVDWFRLAAAPASAEYASGGPLGQVGTILGRHLVLGPGALRRSNDLRHISVAVLCGNDMLPRPSLLTQLWVFD
jgi:hypothetical protein